MSQDKQIANAQTVPAAIKSRAEVDHERKAFDRTNGITRSLGVAAMLDLIAGGAEEEDRESEAEAPAAVAEQLHKMGAARVRRASRAGVVAAVKAMTGRR